MMKPFMKSFLLFIAICLACAELGKAQVIVNPDGTHTVVTGNVIVNPNGTHSVLNGNILVNPDGTHSVIPLTAPSGNLLNKTSGNVNNQFGQWFIKLFTKKDRTKVKQAKEDRQRARGKLSAKRFSNPK
jgi:hypothetical protein